MVLGPSLPPSLPPLSLLTGAPPSLGAVAAELGRNSEIVFVVQILINQLFKMSGYITDRARAGLARIGLECNQKNHGARKWIYIHLLVT